MHLDPGKQVKSSGGVSGWSGARSRENQEASLGLQPGVTGRRFWGMSQVAGGRLSSLNHCAPGQPLLSLDGRSDCSFSHSTSCCPFHPEQTGKDQSWGAQGAPWALASALSLGMDICLLVTPSFPTQEEVPEPWTVLAGVLRHEHPGVSPRKHPW